MKLAHSVVVTPHRAGIYETARDLAQAARAAGHDSRLIDPQTPRTGADRGVPIVSEAYVAKADVIINHSGLSPAMQKADMPIIHMLHGRPYSSFLLEQYGKLPIYSYWRTIAKDKRFKAFITFWPELTPYFENMFDRPIYTVPAPVDLERWTPEGPTGYKFGGLKGETNVVVTDIWRDDKDPYHVINAFMQFAVKHRRPKLHVYAAPDKAAGWKALMARLGERGWLGEVKGFVQGLDNVYRSADVLISPQTIATRSVREALACGCQVVAGRSTYTGYGCDPEDIIKYAALIEDAASRKKNFSKQAVIDNRARAECYFDPAETAETFIKIVEEVAYGGG